MMHKATPDEAKRLDELAKIIAYNGKLESDARKEARFIRNRIRMRRR